MASTGAPSDARYLGMKRFHSSSPSPIRNIAPATAVVLRSSPSPRASRARRPTPTAAEGSATVRAAARLARAPGVERVVHRALQEDLLVVVVAVQRGEAVGDGAQPVRLRRRRRQVGGDVGAVHDPA